MNYDTRVEIDVDEIIIIRSPHEANRLNTTTFMLIPLADVTQAITVRGPHGSRYVRVQVTRTVPRTRPDRDPRSVRFERHHAHRAEALAASISAKVSGHQNSSSSRRVYKMSRHRNSFNSKLPWTLAFAVGVLAGTWVLVDRGVL